MKYLIITLLLVGCASSEDVAIQYQDCTDNSEVQFVNGGVLLISKSE